MNKNEIIIAIPGQKGFKVSEFVEDGYIEMNGLPPSENHYAINGEWKLITEFLKPPGLPDNSEITPPKIVDDQ